jgi:Protein of unknown function, DUF547
MTEAQNSPRIRRIAWLLGLGLLVFALSLFACGNLLEGLWGPPAVTQGETWGPKGGREGAGQSLDHADFDRILRDIVDAKGLVHYDRAAAQRGQLEAYWRKLSAADFDSLSRDEKLAFLINAYNAATLLLILDHLPLESIRDIPKSERWDARRWDLMGKRLSLSQIEHEYLRKHFADPRIHFAINCASLGCPPLRAEAYQGARIEAQLEDQARRIHSDPYWFSFSDNTLHLTRLYLWYRGDFVQKSGSIPAFAARWSPTLSKALAQGLAPSLDYLPYDWALNQSGAR